MFVGYLKKKWPIFFPFSKKIVIFCKFWCQKWIGWLTSILEMHTFTNITAKVSKLWHFLFSKISGLTTTFKKPSDRISSSKIYLVGILGMIYRNITGTVFSVSAQRVKVLQSNFNVNLMENGLRMMIKTLSLDLVDRFI